jgi:sarcosine oxidase subunit alpha
MTTSGAFEAGEARAREALEALGRTGLAQRWPGVAPEPVLQQAPIVPTDGPAPCFVDLQHDVTTADLALARREGYAGAELAKRYTTLGMGTDQGKTSGLNGIAVLAALQGQSIAATGTTTFRPPYSPVAIGALAGFHRGRQFRPTRLPPAHAWAEAEGAVFVEAGPWLRAQYFPRPGETDWLESVDREVRAVRGGVGVCDVSTLGKIELAGPDALAFLERLYANDLQSLRVGRCRYGLMLREDGHVFDDGTVARLDETRFVVTTTTANAVAVFQHMQFCHQVLWPTFDVQFASVTDQWAQFSIAGPRAREVVAAVLEAGTALDDAAFPFMAAGAVRLAGGGRARLFRISFSGERAYELAVPARAAIAVLERLFAAGAPYGIVPYGTEALGVMRIEKGHVAGNELNGQTTAADLGLGRLQSTKKDYIGAVLARREGLVDPSRPRLVGLRPVDRTARLYAGAHFIGLGTPRTAVHDAGFMTSVAHSPGLGHWIGLGLLRDGARRHGESLLALDALRGTEVVVEVCDPVFVDPSGGRLRG